jgi:L-tartrate/succinate antiporter
VGLAIALVPTPVGLSQAAWSYFALFVTVLIAIITEPIPAPVVGLAGVVTAAMLGLVQPTPALSINWALGGFSNPLAWLILSTLVLASGYEKTALGRRIALWLIKHLGRRTLGIGYAIALTDLALAPFTPSNTARSAGTIYPVIRNIPGLFDSNPEAHPRRIGAYLMYTALAATCVTSSMFPTAIAANLLAVAIVAETLHIDITWREWVVGFAPAGAMLLLLAPLVLYRIYPPGLTHAPDAPAWAAEELRKMGRMGLIERSMLGGILLVVGLWIFGSRFTDPTAAAILGVILLIARGIVTWDDVTSNRQAWSVFVWFATLVTLAGASPRSASSAGSPISSRRRCRAWPFPGPSPCSSPPSSTFTTSSPRCPATPPRCCLSSSSSPPGRSAPRRARPRSGSASRWGSWASSRPTRPAPRPSTTPAAISGSATSGGSVS